MQEQTIDQNHRTKNLRLKIQILDFLYSQVESDDLSQFNARCEQQS